MHSKVKGQINKTYGERIHGVETLWIGMKDAVPDKVGIQKGGTQFYIPRARLCSVTGESGVHEGKISVLSARYMHVLRT